MLDNEISECCRRLRLSRNLAERAQFSEGRSHQEYLYNLLSSELEYRTQTRTEKLVSSAGFNAVKTFDGYRFDEITLPSDLTVESLKSLVFIHEKKNLIMYGGTGTGKTMLSTALGISACKQGIPVKFFRTAALVNRLSEAKKAGTLSAFLKKLNKAEVIILDEYGYVPLDRTGAQLLFEIISDCYEQKSIILNTNLEFSRWANILYDEQMTAAMLDRLLHHCHLLLFPGASNRMKESSINDLYRSISENAIK
ncbi:IS21-like element helper ATPase IstB [Parasporobacterium paucivorans]|uniref:DNA replication protein DnaC n=1 Tax=Parasporobacterium paucivorans DSM 15970 TaxID=1122934 RepID=A0A1M6EBA9_9FIRM|nr:IS21-like element helper ATPase IstB [Parasporobacterium paucivorans]SHI82786.1 DNA replication protein DnaC [Parasporobacterium paucivorans DSM 15970]